MQNLGLFGRGSQYRLADGLRLEERPQVRGFDIGRERGGLGALAQRFRERKHQREDGDQQGNALVAAVMVYVPVSPRHVRSPFSEFYLDLTTISRPASATAVNAAPA